MFWNSVNIISFWSSLLFIYFFLLVWFLVLSSGLKFLTIFINCDVHVCHGHLLKQTPCTLDMFSCFSECCWPWTTQMWTVQGQLEMGRFISVVNTVLLHGPMVESADMNNVRCGGPTIQLRADFQLHSGSVPLIPSPCCSRVSCTTLLYHRLFQIHVVFSLSQRAAIRYFFRKPSFPLGGEWILWNNSDS